MRRTKLVWFAVGAAFTSVIWIVADELLASSQPVAVISVSDKEWIDPALMKGKSNADIAIQMSSATIVQKCRTKVFETHWDGGSHTFPKTDIRISPESVGTLNCILANAPEEGFPVTVSFKAE